VTWSIQLDLGWTLQELGQTLHAKLVHSRQLQLKRHFSPFSVPALTPLFAAFARKSAFIRFVVKRKFLRLPNHRPESIPSFHTSPKPGLRAE
jgi:hypothetical protein